MQSIRDDLQAWKTRGGGGVGEGVAGEVGLGGLIGDMQREVLLIAVTPTEQEMKSSVGREVRLPLRTSIGLMYSCGSAHYMLYTISRC